MSLRKRTRPGSVRHTGRSPHWVKIKNPNAPAVKQEAEEDWMLALDVIVWCVPSETTKE